VNLSRKVLALMAALAAGAAGAAGTTAGTVINNQASATYTDPSTSNPASTVSNTVSTTVNPVPNFTITPNDVGPGATQNAPVPAYDKTGVVPGSQQAFQYVVSNTGNTPVTVNLTTQNRTDTTVTGVAYYLDTNNDGLYTPGTDTPLTDTNGDGIVDTGSIAPDAKVNILQVYTVPTTATPGSYYGADPVGAGQYDPTYKPGNAVPTTTSTTVVPDPTTGTGALTDLDNFNRVLVYTPQVTLGPIDANSPGGTAPVGTGPTDGQTNPGSGSTPGGTQPTYNDPTNPGTAIGVSGSMQKAYPPADADTTTADKVTFVNSITNTGSNTDSFFLLPPTGLPAGVTVTYLDASGNPLPLVTNPADGNQYPQLTNIAPGTTVNFRVVVTYPDTDGTTPPVSPITVNVPVDSASDADATPNATATDMIYPPVLQFGDATAALGTSPTPAPDQIVTPGTAPTLTSNNNGDSTAIFPMDLANIGGYDEAYKLTGSVTVPLAGGGTTTVPVKYYIDTNNDGNPDTLLTVDGSGNYVSPVVVAGTEQKVYAVIDIPANAAATVANGVSTPLAVSQQATGAVSGIVRQDNNDTVSIAPTGTIALTKSVDKTNAKPGEDLTYTIVAKNGFNTAIKNFVLKEADGTGTTNVFANSVFKSVVASLNPAVVAPGQIVYRFNGGSWQTSAAPTVPLTSVTTVDVAYDSNGDGTITALDTLDVGATLTETLVVTIK